MPWKECHVMDERLRFVTRRLEGEKMALLCGDATSAGDVTRLLDCSQQRRATSLPSQRATF